MYQSNYNIKDSAKVSIRKYGRINLSLVENLPDSAVPLLNPVLDRYAVTL